MESGILGVYITRGEDLMYLEKEEGQISILTLEHILADLGGG